MRIRLRWPALALSALLPVAAACSLLGGLDDLKGGDGDSGTEVPCGDSDAGLVVGEPCNSGLQGVCAAGKVECVAGTPVCQATVQPSDEVCNGKDDDCDGIPDDGFEGSGAACVVKGVPPDSPCASGLTSCLDGDCTQVTFAELETCDGIDNDCDGIVDNPADVKGSPCDTGLPGACGPGKTACDSGISSCVPDVQPGSQNESCNGIDDDCNGTADDVGDLSAECSTKQPLAANVAVWKCDQSGCAIEQCGAGFENCNGAVGDGCEVSVNTDSNNCGKCGNVCTSPNGTAKCNAGACSTISCTGAFADCDGDANNGCETPTNTLTDCGACGAKCDYASAKESCATGSCQLTSCDTGRGNCDGNVGNGCETSTTTDPKHCGACGRACSATNVAGLACAGGICTSTCVGLTMNCKKPAAPAADDGCETDLLKDCTPCGCVTKTFGENSTDTVKASSIDTYVWGDHQGRNYGAAALLLVDGGSSPDSVSLLRFDVSSIPKTATIVSAKLSVNLLAGEGSSAVFYLRQVLEGWEEGNLDNLQGIANFTQRQSPNVLWTTTGARPPGSTSNTPLASFVPLTTGPRLVQLTVSRTLVDGWVKGTTPNYGLGITTSSSDGARFHSSESPTDGQRPSLSVTYVP